MTVAAPARVTRWRPPALPLVAGAGAAALGLLLGQAITAPSMKVRLLLVILVAPMVLALTGARRALLALTLADIAFVWDVNLHYRTDAAAVGALGGLSLSITTVALAALYGGWIGDALARPRAAAAPRLRAAAPLALYVAITGLSLLVAGDRSLGINELALLVQTLLLFVYLASNVRRVADVRLIASVLVGVALLESLIVLGQRAGVSIHVPGSAVHVDNTFGEVRFGGTVGSPNTAAAFFATLLPLSVALAMTATSRFVRRASGLTVVLAAAALAMTGSRGGTIGGAIGLLVFAGAALWRRWVSPRKLAVAGVLLAVGLAPFIGLVIARAESDKGAAQSRVPLNALAIQTIKQHPVLGVGANNVGVVFTQIAGPQYSRDWIYTVHDKYLLVAAEAGLLALAAFLAFLITTLDAGRRAVRRHGRELSLLSAALAAGVAAQIVQMFVDLFQSRPQVQLLWVVAALLAALRFMPVDEPGAA